ncbi:MAG: hypothetical protein ACXWRU_19105 [Pseudobdellovibrionaceae bacterium]
MKNKWLYILHALLITQPTFAGGVLIGSGGDSLAQNEKQEVRPLGDVVVPVPPQISAYGQLLVTGMPGNGQSEVFRYAKCEKGKNGAPKKFSCNANSTSILNETQDLKPGYYKINYSGSITFLEIKQNSVTEVSLRKIQIPKVNGNFKAEVFFDLSSLSMEDLALRLIFSNSYGEENFKGLCANNSKQIPKSVKAACAAWNSDDYRNLNMAVLRFSNDGTASLINVDGSFDKPVHVFVNSAATAGDFISVFPGVYGITFTDLQTKESVSQLGIYVD